MTGQILTAFVATKNDLVDLIGTRIRPQTGEQSDLKPYLVYQEIDGQPIWSLGGPSGLAQRRLQVNVVASSYGEAKLIARLLCGTKDDIRFDGFKGPLAGVNVQCVQLVDIRDVYEQPQSGQARGCFEIQLDFMVAFDESAITAASFEG